MGLLDGEVTVSAAARTDRIEVFCGRAWIWRHRPSVRPAHPYRLPYEGGRFGKLRSNWREDFPTRVHGRSFWTFDGIGPCPSVQWLIY
jgi:hypothetical protein